MRLMNNTMGTPKKRGCKMKRFNFRTVMAYFSVILVLVFGLLLLKYDVEHSPKNRVEVTVDTALPVKPDGYSISMSSREGQGWWEPLDPDNPDVMSHGMCYDGVISNNSDGDIDDWSVTFELPKDGFVSELWNASWTVEGSTVTVTALSHNTVIERQTKETFGFILYTPQPAKEFTMFEFSASKIRIITDEVLYWVLLLAIFTTVVVMLTNIAAYIRYRRIRNRYRMWRELTEQSMRTIAKTIDAKDKYTSGHSYRVAVISRLLAHKAGLSQAEQENIYYIGLLHDIGKIGVPDSTLNKSGSLTESEWTDIKRHPSIGGDILKDITSIPDIEHGARYHHERWDGTGYNEGKKGTDIPLSARIICIADAYDAMSTKRCYRPKFEDDYIIAELERCAGTQFDPSLVPHMIELIKNGEISFEGNDKAE